MQQSASQPSNPCSEPHPNLHSQPSSSQPAPLSRLQHLQIYVHELQRELLKYKQLHQHEHSLRKQLQRQNRVLQIRLDRLTQKRVRFNEQSEAIKKDQNGGSIKDELRNFSTMIDSRIQRIASEAGREKDEDKVNLIQNFAVFGVSEAVISENGQELVDGMIVTSLHKPTDADQQAAKMVFPSGAMIKRMFGDKIYQKATELITKSYSRQNSFVLSFQNQQSSKPVKTNPQTQNLLNALNPQRRLFCLCIGTYDFTYCSHSEPIDTTSTSMLVGEREALESSVCSSEIVRPNASNTPEEIAVSQRVYCISSYFPFFSFFEEVLLLLLNMLKIERLEIFQDQIEGLAHADSRYHSFRMKQLFQLKLNKIMARSIMPNMVYQVRLLNQTISLNTKPQTLLLSSIQQSLYQILSIFTLDTFLQVLSLALLQDKLVFVCQNSHILTYTVYLFANVLVRPLIYAFASVYILPSEEFLSVPFPVVYGLLKKKKWIEQNNILERFRNTYVFLTPLGVYVQYTEAKRDRYNIERLRAMLNNYFKELDKSRRLTANKSQNCRIEINQYVQHSTQEQRSICMKILQTVRKFLQQDILQFIPSKQKMYSLKQQALSLPIPKLKDKHTHIIQHIIRYIKQTRKSKDPFFNRMLHTQMISMHFQTLL